MNKIELFDGQGYVELVDHMGDELRIVNAAKISYGRQTDTLDENSKGILKSLLSNGHTSPLEQVCFTFLVKAPIFVVRQWFRHRTWSYNEKSRRYSKDTPEFYIPEYFTGGNVNPEDKSAVERVFNASYIYAKDMYETLLAKGVKAEQARIVLPTAMMTEFYGTVDLSNLIKFLNLRDDAHAQYEIQEYAKAIKTLVKPILPTVAEALGW